jgi:hypothetical protein
MANYTDQHAFGPVLPSSDEEFDEEQELSTACVRCGLTPKQAKSKPCLEGM